MYALGVVGGCGILTVNTVFGVLMRAAENQNLAHLIAIKPEGI